jgi:hypothetical protein
MAWNREHAGVAAAPAVAIDWSVTAMTEAAGRLATAGAWELPRLAAAVGETVWWVTLVDATLVRYHPRDYESALASKAVRRRQTEETLEGLRYARNELGRSVDPAEFVCPVAGVDGAAWTWRPLPEPGLGRLTSRARVWELSRYRAYQARLAGRDIARTFARCTEFLAQAAGLVGGVPPSPGTQGLRARKQVVLSGVPTRRRVPGPPPPPHRGTAREASPYREYRAYPADRPLGQTLARAADFLSQVQATAGRAGHRGSPAVTG